MKTQSRENSFESRCECTFFNVNTVITTILSAALYLNNQYQSVKNEHSTPNVSYDNNESHFYQSIHLLQAVVKILQCKC